MLSRARATHRNKENPVSTIDERIAELAIEIPHQAAAPAGTYVPAVISGQYVYTAGQLPFVGGTLPATGKVGAAVTPEEAYGYARIAAINALAAIAAVIGSLDRVTRVVKVVGFVASDPAFTGQPAVLNGASEVLGAIFGDAGVHARSAVGVAVLPLDSPVEVELIVEFS
jgi:enamine deaminase RidA (YjgF/YER057c/UK114 family)